MFLIQRVTYKYGETEKVDNIETIIDENEAKYFCIGANNTLQFDKRIGFQYYRYKEFIDEEIESDNIQETNSSKDTKIEESKENIDDIISNPDYFRFN